jgi:hypothetical protein
MMWKQIMIMRNEKSTLMVEIIMPLCFGFAIGAQFQESDAVMGTTMIMLFGALVNQQGCLAMMTDMVMDKQTKMKETLKIMGLDSGMYSMGYFVFRCLTSILNAILIVGVVAQMSKESEFFDTTKLLTFFLAQCLININLTSVSLIMQDFFQDPTLVQIIGPIIFFIPMSILLVATNHATVVDEPILWPIYFYWIPTTPYFGVVGNILDPEKPLCKIPDLVSWLVLLISPFIFYRLHIYLEQVLPNDFGSKQPCCFCFNKAKKTAKIFEMSSLNLTDGNAQNQAIASFREDDPIQFRGMTKKFGDFKAVNQLTLSVK